MRTFPLVSTAGFLTAVLAADTGTPLIVAAGVVGAFGFAFMMMHLRSTLGQTGLTTPAVMVVTFLLGVLVGYGRTLEAVAVGVVATFLLVTKERLHRFARILDEDEILSTLQFVTLAFILLPVTANLPDELWGQAWLGRGALVDPYVILLVVLFVSAISFASLVAMREIGPRRGLEFSGLLGGLVNSEATTASLAQRVREEEALAPSAVVGAILASTTMLARNLAIAAFADPSLALAVALAPYLLGIALVGAALSLRQRKTRGEGVPAVRIKNPFAVGPALRFAILFAAVSMAATVASDRLGDLGVYATSLGGFVSAGAVVASLGGLAATGQVSLEVATRTCLLATLASLAGKPFILRAVHPPLVRRALPAFAVLAGAGAVATVVAFLV